MLIGWDRLAEASSFEPLMMTSHSVSTLCTHLLLAKAAEIFCECSTATALRPWSKCVMRCYWPRPARGSMLDTQHPKTNGHAKLACGAMHSVAWHTRDAMNRQEQKKKKPTDMLCAHLSTILHRERMSYVSCGPIFIPSTR